MSKKTNCLNCKHWNKAGGCFLYFHKLNKKKEFELKNNATNKICAFIMPSKPPEEYKCNTDVSSFYKKDGKCIWYKFNLLDAIFNRMD